MESTRHKTFTQLRTQLSVAAVLVFVLLMCPAFSTAGQYNFVPATDVDIRNYGDDRIGRILEVVYFSGANYYNTVVNHLKNP